MKSIFMFAFLLVLSYGSVAQTDSLWGIVKDGISLDEITIKADRSNNEIQMKLPQNLIKLDKNFIESNFSGSLMQSLSNIPGVKAVNIGSGQSKPAIRGLGFNRMAVCENGIKHQGQQWGHEHGLEIDQFAVDDIEIIKGPAAMLYGSDAIGGVICLNYNALPKKRSESEVNLFARSNNRLLGISGYNGGKFNRFFYKFNFTLTKYSDYIVPADSIQYYSYYIKLKNNRLRNTAGNESDVKLTLGYNGKKLKSFLNFSEVYTKSGFFANAHGVEVRLSQIDFDKSFSDIDYPYSTAGHFKILNNNSLKIGRNTLNLDIAFQLNGRKEYSEPVSHGYMPKPNSFLEREFNKKTYSLNLNYKSIVGNLSLNYGLTSEYQDNTSGGWGYILPSFKQFSSGIFVFGKYHLPNNFIVSAGIRTDFANIKISEYYDWYQTPTENGDYQYIMRSPNVSKHWNCVIYSAGINWQPNDWVFKVNVGKSFRVPTASELGADGVNYQIFRYERGNPDLKPEQSYQLDLGINYENRKFNFYLTPFVNFFPDYIYLNPDYHYVEGLQLFEYVQCKVFRTGVESEVGYTINRKAEFTIGGEYLFARQLSGDKKGYGLPFSQPWNCFASTKCYIPQHKRVNECYVLMSYTFTGAQNNIVPPEKSTDSHQIVNISFAKKFAFKNLKLKTELSVQNLLNSKYYDHTSYYRLIDVPEPGRNFSLLIGLNF